MKIGRNDLCPCGSGKKYKKCCIDVACPPTEVPEDLTPSELVKARARAFGEGDFAFIYDTYHPDSYFLRQFPQRRAYIRHGESTLSEDFEIHECRIIKDEVAGEEARVIFYLDTLFQGERAESFELSFFQMTSCGWRYHSSQKMTREDYQGGIDDLDWEDFEKVKDKVFF